MPLTPPAWVWRLAGMRLAHGIHLAYCTNIHRGETLAEIRANLARHTLAVRERIAPGQPYAIGLRLGFQAARELAQPNALQSFADWLNAHGTYVFTINGFPFGPFHGTRVKAEVYLPDWAAPERLEYTQGLFDLLARLLPDGVPGSISTLPVGFKRTFRRPEQWAKARQQLWACVDHIARLRERTGKDLMLALEPEPLCCLETTLEVADFFDAMREDRPHDGHLDECLGVNYDTCHLAVEYEEPMPAFRRLEEAGIAIAKVHLSSALKVRPGEHVRALLRGFVEPTYLHQVVARDADGGLRRYEDLDQALNAPARETALDKEWRIHFHIPLHCRPSQYFDPASQRGQMDFADTLSQSAFDSTADHLRGVLDLIGQRPCRCRQFEMETYTWEVLPPELRQRSVVDQLAAEYEWTLAEFARRGIGRTDVPESTESEQ